ncbi:Cu(+)/Ag(+) sensor histidine kinase [Neisseria sp. Ec49-e6-T10]|uniref:Cu(+)/Ag(+) sensor histidine kinase n=1 Tax=Neisseria sp. Ec49-e6-T10 TaxID=3140744 RepID=UPI003EBC6460
MNNAVKRPLSLILRLTLFIGVANVLIFLVFGWFIERSVEQHFDEQDILELNLVIQSIQKVFNSHLVTDNQYDPIRKDLDSILDNHRSIAIRIFQASKIIYQSDQVVVPETYLQQANNHIQFYTWQAQNKQYHIALKAMNQNNSRIPYTVMVVMDKEFHLHYIHEFRRHLWAVMLSSSLVMILVSCLLVYHGLTPLRRINTQIQRIGSEQLHLRLSENVPRELIGLVSSFNHMIERIEDVFQRQSNFSADIAHEMRTPITNLTTQTQIALSQARSTEEYREILYSNLEEYGRLAKMINDMLFLAQADSKLLIPEKTKISLKAELENLFDYFEAWAEDRDVTLTLLGDVSTIDGDRLMIRRALSNLLSNAIRYTPKGQSVTVTLSVQEQTVCICVQNLGKTISKEHLSHLFDRFYRVDQSRQRNGEGAGIGLAIVQSIIEAHEGSISVTSTNGLTQFIIFLPNSI